MDVLSSCIERLIICGASITNVDFHFFQLLLIYLFINDVCSRVTYVIYDIVAVE